MQAVYATILRKHNLWRPGAPLCSGIPGRGNPGTDSAGQGSDRRRYSVGNDVRAHIETMDGISSHADRDGAYQPGYPRLRKKPDYVFVVHGSEESCVSFSDVLNTQLKLTARAPFSGSQFDLIKGLLD